MAMPDEVWIRDEWDGDGVELSSDMDHRAKRYVPAEKYEALAAYVEELHTLLTGAQLGLRWFRNEHPNEDTETDAEFDTQVSVALQASRETSLVRVIAQAKAEALRDFANGFELGETYFRAHVAADRYDEEYRRQVEGATYESTAQE